jgi:hypothetical protein
MQAYWNWSADPLFFHRSRNHRLHNNRLSSLLPLFLEIPVAAGVLCRSDKHAFGQVRIGLDLCLNMAR